MEDAGATCRPKGHSVKSSWDTSRLIPLDIPPALAWRVIQFARMVREAKPGAVFLVTRAIEADVMRWEKRTKTKSLDSKRNPL